ncbi:hydroxylase [Engelhardtia mirabilis]|uniref:Hydroxylase n=1 Tax=Engelhardtia mirabilis TaxID=2528011 RepID=A0A518BM47_9BACT|nr:hypothetical protein Pla133_31430 [Planctomycetes bacterium Pla133]QDV02377.1 hypothetical protein Pla86_31420 [Planctomycetes bacterium Pla86]
MQVHYLEIVTTDVEGVCTRLEREHDTVLGEGDPLLGGARTAPLAGGGMVGVRAPLDGSEQAVVRPYFLVDDIEAAVAAAQAQGAEVAHPPLELPGRGSFSILIQGGLHHGLWQL